MKRRGSWEFLQIGNLAERTATESAVIQPDEASADPRFATIKSLNNQPTLKEFMMQKLIITAALAATAFISISGSFALAASVACEDMKTQIEETLKTAKPSDTDKAKFDELVSKGDERCKAEDDRRSDAFYTDALALLGVKAQ